jgi:hypothetical protein
MKNLVMSDQDRQLRLYNQCRKLVDKYAQGVPISDAKLADLLMSANNLRAHRETMRFAGNAKIV